MKLQGFPDLLLLEQLVRKCKGGVTLSINPHQNECEAPSQYLSFFLEHPSTGVFSPDAAQIEQMDREDSLLGLEVLPKEGPCLLLHGLDLGDLLRRALDLIDPPRPSTVGSEPTSPSVSPPAHPS